MRESLPGTMPGARSRRFTDCESGRAYAPVVVTVRAAVIAWSSPRGRAR